MSTHGDAWGRSPEISFERAVDKGIFLIGNVIGYSGKDGDMREKFAKYGHAFVMKTGPRSDVLCIDRPEDITAVLSSKSFIPAWPRAYLYLNVHVISTFRAPCSGHVCCRPNQKIPVIIVDLLERRGSARVVDTDAVVSSILPPSWLETETRITFLLFQQTWSIKLEGDNPDATTPISLGLLFIVCCTATCVSMRDFFFGLTMCVLCHVSAMTDLAMTREPLDKIKQEHRLCMPYYKQHSYPNATQGSR